MPQVHHINNMAPVMSTSWVFGYSVLHTEYRGMTLETNVPVTSTSCVMPRVVPRMAVQKNMFFREHP